MKQELKQLADISGNRLLGNPDSNSGNIREVEIGSGLTFSNNTISSTSTLSNLGTDKIWVGDVNGVPQEVDKSTLGSSGVTTLNNGQLFVGDNTNNAQSVDMSGDVNIDNTGSTTIQPDSVTYDKIQDVSQASILGNETGSGVIQEIPIVEQYLPTGSLTTLLDDVSNWNANNDYVGTTITGTYQGQSHYNGSYWFTAVDDDVWIIDSTGSIRKANFIDIKTNITKKIKTSNIKTNLKNRH